MQAAKQTWGATVLRALHDWHEVEHGRIPTRGASAAVPARKARQAPARTASSRKR